MDLTREDLVSAAHFFLCPEGKHCPVWSGLVRSGLLKVMLYKAPGESNLSGLTWFGKNNGATEHMRRKYMHIREFISTWIST